MSKSSNKTKVEYITSNDEHWYPSPRKKDVWYPSATTIVGKIFPKGIGFQRYLANQSSWEESRKVLEAAGRRGTNVHEATELLEEGKTLYCENYTMEEWQMIEGFVKWYNAHQPKVLYTEERFASDRLRTGGTIDRVYEIDGEIVVLDFKTSSAIHDNYWAQTAIYWALLKEKTKIEADKTAVLRLAPRRKLGYEYVLHDRDQIKEDLAAFKHAQKMWDYLYPKAAPKLLEVPTEFSLELEKCSVCDGHGEVTQGEFDDMRNVPCPECKLDWASEKDQD